MPDFRTKIIDLLEFWGLIAGTVTLLYKAWVATLSNKKSVKELKVEVEQLKREIISLNDHQEDIKESIKMLMELIISMKK